MESDTLIRDLEGKVIEIGDRVAYRIPKGWRVSRGHDFGIGYVTKITPKRVRIDDQHIVEGRLLVVLPKNPPS